MHNKKIIAKGLIVSILLLNAPTDAMADMVGNYKLSDVNKEENNSLKENKFEEFFNNIFDKFKKPKEIIKVNKNIVVGKVKEVTIEDGEFVPNLDGNVEGYETIRVTTIGNKKLVKEDYDNLRASEIPKIDLSNAKSDKIPQGAFYKAIHLTEFKFPQGIKYIGDNSSTDGVFEGCLNLNGNLEIPNTVVEIGYSAFEHCSSFYGELTIPSSVIKIGPGAFRYCTGFTGNLIIPNSVISIGSSAFEECYGFNGNLILSNNVTEIGYYAFFNCSGFKGDLIIPNSLKSISINTFNNCNNLNKIVIKVGNEDSIINYKKSIIDFLPDTKQTVIDLPYDFNTTNTWLENTNKTIGKPIIKNIMNEEEIDIIDNEIGQKVSLYIPATHQKEGINVLKDGKPYNTPKINKEEKYIFNETGTYNVSITTILGNNSNLTFKVQNDDYSTIEEIIIKAQESKNPADIEKARDLVNSLPESTKKDEFQKILDSILPNIEFETKNATANLDVYIKSENMLSLSLNTNSVTFEDFSGVEDMEKLNALTLTVNSSLPYDIKAYLPVEITGSKYSEALNKEIFNIRANGENDYQTFEDTETPLTLLSGQEAGNDKEYRVDFKLKGGLAYKKDIYKATIKFEVEQK